ncbi:MAG: glutamine synthetase III [Clostridia bacterium]|nr:glutamine synthetase III [Clostridia bacterium]
MRQRLPQNIYQALHRAIEEGTALDPAAAEVIAAAMKEWAVERGATHYTHWFQPLSGQSAEKQEAFIAPHKRGNVMLEFSGRALIRGEADASSFPNGGLRATFEARGYTAWDCTAPAFLREDPGGIIALCIPTAFCSFNGEALDTRTPLLRASEALSKQAVRVLRALGDGQTRRVYANVGLEQEYFLIDRDLYRNRRDLVYTGRTLFGANPPKGQEMNDQYYAAMRQRVSGFMAELNLELWKLGVAAKTQHNEAAPSQHEVAVSYDSAMAACDQNQLTMMMLRKVAARRGMAALLHEKPFACVSGSGKHNNWSLSTDGGKNLLDPGKDPAGNVAFRLFFLAVIAAVDRFPGLLRMTSAGLSNDQRLGGEEAPTPMVSVYIGEPLLRMLRNGALTGAKGTMHSGVSTMPELSLDYNDRNRTSPFAFTGDKFEFRMLGSSQSAASANAVMAAIVADELQRMADCLEGAEDPPAEAQALCARLFAEHEKVFFNGDCYSEEWEKKAKERGLRVYPTSVEAIEALDEPEAVAMFERQRVFTRQELRSRVQMRHVAYIKALRIEGNTMAEMQRRAILPAAMRWQAELAAQCAALDAAGACGGPQKAELAAVTGQIGALHAAVEELERLLAALPEGADKECAAAWRDGILPAMEAVRTPCDALETRMPRDLWPVPTYGALLYHV